MPVLKALKKFSYNAQRLRPGDLFKCKDKHVAMLVVGGLAHKPEVYDTPEPSVVQPAPAVYSTRSMEAGRITASPKTVIELRTEAEAKGIYIPKGKYIPKSELIRMIEES